MLEFINLFFVPVVSVYIWERRNYNNGFVPSIKLLISYIISVVVNVPITHFVGKFVEGICGRQMNPTGAVYTLAALCVASFVPYVYEIVRLRVSISIAERKK